MSRLVPNGHVFENLECGLTGFATPKDNRCESFAVDMDSCDAPTRPRDAIDYGPNLVVTTSTSVGRQRVGFRTAPMHDLSEPGALLAADPARSVRGSSAPMHIGGGSRPDDSDAIAPISPRKGTKAPMRHSARVSTCDAILSNSRSTSDAAVSKASPRFSCDELHQMLARTYAISDPGTRSPDAVSFSFSLCGLSIGPWCS